MSQTEDQTGSALERENLVLKQKIDELERTLSAAEAKPVKAKNKLVASRRWVKALFLLLLGLSLIPSWLVVRDRWFGHLTSITSVDEMWWSVLTLRALAYPRYFLIIFIIVLLTGSAVFLWPRGPLLIFANLSLGKTGQSADLINPQQYRIGRYLLIAALVIVNISALFVFFAGRIPGWELVLALLLYGSSWLLLEFPLNEIETHLRRQYRFLLAAALFIIGLCCALYGLFGEKPNLIFYVLFVLAAANFLRYRRAIPAIFWISTAALTALTWKINGWEYVVIGDEYSFYTEIRNILENRTAWELINNTFNGNFVYGTHPYFSSYIQDFFMKLFDNHNFGWRFSNPFLVASSLFFFYYFFKAFIPRRTALVTVALLGFSHYLLSFSKIGYNNLQALFALGLVLAAFTWALQSMKLVTFSLLGLSMGLCFYLYPAALYILPLPILGLLLYLPPKNRSTLKYWAWMIIALALLVYPLIPQPRYWAAKVAGTFFYTSASDSANSLLHNISVNLLYSALSFLYTPQESHYVSTGYMDPLSSAFIVIGFAYLMERVYRRNKSALFLALSFLAMFFIVGATHGRNFPTATRMFLLLPWFALFTAFGLEWCTEKFEVLFNANRQNLINLAVALIVLVNLYEAYNVDIANMAQYHTLPPLFVKTVRQINANSQVPPKAYAFVAPPSWDTSGMLLIQEVYLVPDSPRQLIDLPLDGDQLPASDSELVSQRDIVVIVKADIDGSLIAQVDTQLAGWGKLMCEIRNEKGTLQFQLWQSGDLGWLCQ